MFPKTRKLTVMGLRHYNYPREITYGLVTINYILPSKETAASYFIKILNKAQRYAKNEMNIISN